MSARGKLVLDGTGDYVSTDYAGIAGNASRTVCAWVKWNYAAGGCIFDYGESGVSHFRMILLSASKKLRFANEVANLDSASTLADVTWYFVAIVYNTSDDTAYLYINAGAADASSVIAAINTGVDDDVRIGITTAGSNDIQGEISDVMVFNDDLSQAEIQAIYDLGRNPDHGQVAGLAAYGDLISWWPFTINADDEKGSNHGTLQADAYVDTEANVPCAKHHYSIAGGL